MLPDDAENILWLLFVTRCLYKCTDTYSSIQVWNYWGADKSLTQPISPCTLFDGDNISFDASLVICI